jgi:hypothetical protein
MTAEYKKIRGSSRKPEVSFHAKEEELRYDFPEI